MVCLILARAKKMELGEQMHATSQLPVAMVKQKVYITLNIDSVVFIFFCIRGGNQLLHNCIHSSFFSYLSLD